MMKFLKRSARESPKVTLVLLDWSVRESFHLLHYLSEQNIDRDLFEVLMIEYYSTVSEAAKKFEDQIDTWVLLQVPENCYYHKHLMYNAGILLANGEIIINCDSDAMAKPGFVKTIVDSFKEKSDIVFHIDEFRNNRKDLYPFNYPTFEEVLGPGCINNTDGKTSGIVVVEDPIHTPNYGACMGARRDELIAIGGADEHLDYVGHICGAYDMTFRLVNKGLKEIWHPSEFLYHTWHPGQAGVDNYLGPHDGRHMSTTALEALRSRRILPLTENEAIKSLRLGDNLSQEELAEKLINPEFPKLIDRELLENATEIVLSSSKKSHVGFYLGFRISRENNQYFSERFSNSQEQANDSHKLIANNYDEIRKEIESTLSPKMRITKVIFRIYSVFYLIYRLTIGVIYRRSKKLSSRISSLISDHQDEVKKSGADRNSPPSQYSNPPTSILEKIRVGMLKIEQLFMMRKHWKKSIVDMTVNTHNITRDTLDRISTFELLLDNKHDIILMRTLMTLNIIPAINIVQLSTETEVQKYFEAIDSTKKLIISPHLYEKFYPKIADSPAGREAYIL